MSTQDWLLQARVVGSRIGELRLAREQAKRLLGLRSPGLYFDRVQTSRENNRERHMIRYLALEEEINREEERLLAVEREILEAIDRVDDLLLCTILTAYYVNAKTLETIAEELNYSVRQISRLHQKAVAAVEAASAERAGHFAKRRQ